MNVTDDKRKKAFLLHYAGNQVQDIFETFKDNKKATYDETVQHLTEYFQPKRNLSYEAFNFRKATQKEGETVDQFTACLRKLSLHCEFTNLDREFKSQIELGTNCKTLWKYAFRNPDLKLEDLLLYGRTFEQSEIHAKNVEHGTQHEASEPIVQRNQPRRQQRSKRTFFASRDNSKSPHKFGNPKPNSKQKCFSCGYDFPHVKGPCPA